MPCCHKPIRLRSLTRQLGTAITLMHLHPTLAPYLSVPLVNRPTNGCLRIPHGSHLNHTFFSLRFAFLCTRSELKCHPPIPSSLLQPETLSTLTFTLALTFQHFIRDTDTPKRCTDGLCLQTSIQNQPPTSTNPHPVTSEHLPLICFFYHATSCRPTPPRGPPPTTRSGTRHLSMQHDTARAWD
jgi:hypothetical protein